ncbi:MAG: GAF domain-containing protein [Flavobacteriaceae bacterium]|nr:GAF domain-containing protein [Flavobacteriaceae bacterium]
MKLTQIKNTINQIIENNSSTVARLQEICTFLKNEVNHFDWVGFYFQNGNKKELKLAQFSGKPTDHVIIPFGKGICGQVALSNQNFIVQDVTEQDNYISCGLNVKAEIVIPIFKNGQNIGQIDVDSHQKNPFTIEDEQLLEFVCFQVSKFI